MKMKISQSFVILLLFVQKMTKADGDCLYNMHLKQCSCSHLDLANIMRIISCIQASSFEFNGGSFINTEDFMTFNIEMEQVLGMVRVPVTKITFVNLVLSEEFLSIFINWVYKIPIKLLAFENTTFVGKPIRSNMSGLPPRISSLQFIRVSSHPLIPRDSAFSEFPNWMSNLEELTVMRSQLRNIPCNVSLHFQALSSLDLSENLLQDETITSSFCNGSFPSLKMLKLRNNNLVNYEAVCQTFSNYYLLIHLDLSQNSFFNMSNSSCVWQPSLSHLNLSYTGLEHVNSNLPQNCEVLDLSHNKIEFLNISLHKLKELYLSYNMFSTLSTMGNLPLLQVLAVDGNPIKTLQRGQLQYFKHLNSFKGDNIPYTCSCSFVHEIKEIAETGLTIQQWPDGYICDSPILVKGKLVNDVNHSFFECHTSLLTVVVCIVILLLCVAIIICFVKIQRSSKTRSQQIQTGNSNSVHFQS
ncbi:monocyte differentiation antigen CD14 [Mixophyes fleayi]|uniref:monocyte differentiation antigen CD14 n=1 Tax=Mixophyes fleayi TaxID=3061075 RepID=UPI003F4E3169